MVAIHAPVNLLASVWSDLERSAWRPPERLRVSQWAEKHRRLAPGRSSRPGAWRNRRQPILAPLMDLTVRRGLRGLWEVKPSK